MQYILVHGSWQGGWCWQPLAALLRAQGHKVSCPDLPGHGNHKKTPQEVTYEVYYDFLAQEITQYREPIVLVAHSMSGIMAAPLLDRLGDAISHLFLIAAYVAQNGQSLFDIAMAGGPSVIPSVVTYDEKNKTRSLKLDKVQEAFYHDCPDEIATWVIPQLQPQSFLPHQTPVSWVDSGITRHKRTYILCEKDPVVHPSTQEGILKTYPCKTIRLASGHFPFLSQPQRVAEIVQAF